MWSSSVVGAVFGLCGDGAPKSFQLELPPSHLPFEQCGCFGECLLQKSSHRVAMLGAGRGPVSKHSYVIVKAFHSRVPTRKPPKPVPLDVAYDH